MTVVGLFDDVPGVSDEDDPEAALEPVPEVVRSAAARLLEAQLKASLKLSSALGFDEIHDPYAETAGMLDGETLMTVVLDEDGTLSEIEIETEPLEVVEQEFAEPDAPVLQVRSVVRQPELPRIFKLIITNYNARQALLSKTRPDAACDGEKPGDMTQAEWKELKELYRDMRQSLRPAAEKAVSRADN